MEMVITEAQRSLIDEVNVEHFEEYQEWAEENKANLLKKYDEFGYTGKFEEILEFAYYVASEFMYWKTGYYLLGD